MVKIEYIVCPLCGMNRILEKKEKGRIGFEVDLDRPFVQIRQPGGKLPMGEEVRAEAQRGIKVRRGQAPALGFRLVDGLTFKQAKESGRYDDLIDEIENQCHKILDQF